MASSNVFDRITALLDEIALEKKAAMEGKADACESVEKYKAGPHAQSDDAYIQKYGNPQQPRFGDTPHGPPKGSGADPTGGRATFTGEDPSNEKPARTIEDITLPLEKYKNSKHAAAVPVDELLNDAMTIGNALLYELLESTQKEAAQKDNANQQQEVTKTASNDAVNQQTDSQKNNGQANAAPTMTQDDVTRSINLASGILYGLQKQAEHHADLVGSYLYGKLQEQLQTYVQSKKAEGEGSEATSEEGEEKEENKEKAEESTTTAPPAPQEDTTEELKKNLTESDSSKDEEESSKDEEGSSSARGEEAANSLDELNALGALNEMGGSSPKEDEILQNLAMSLMELGISPNELRAIGGPGEKIASAVDRFQKSGKFRIQPAATPMQKAARDYLKSYISDLVRRSRRSGKVVNV